MKLRDSERLDELRTQYEQVWNTLLYYEEKEAEKLIQDFSSQIDFMINVSMGLEKLKVI
jgi:ABC-type Fe3+-hydroxamate transport system substrate-binding protein